MTWAMRSGRMNSTISEISPRSRTGFPGLEDRRLGHQPETHLGADAVVGLGEHAVQRRAVAPLEHLPGLVALDAAHAGAVDIAVGHHHFHAALHQEVFAIGV
jgi:hypothetical protein